MSGTTHGILSWASRYYLLPFGKMRESLATDGGLNCSIVYGNILLSMLI